MSYSLVILCGGDSSRMGTDKALLPFTDKCLVEYIVSKFSPYFDKIYLSVNQRGDYTNLGLDIIEIPDIYNNAGPFGAILSSLAMISDDFAFFMSVDIPFLDPKVAVYLMEQSIGYDFCSLNFTDDINETTCAVYNKTCIADLAKCLLSRKYTWNDFYSKRSIKLIEIDELESISELSPLQLFYSIKDRDSYYMALFAALKGNFI
ncbi:MAG: molybdenum cofactor guanylyltransferase [Pseudobutyrivibrio sp.]|nr:molybdenum cofactor guanylyltransferase [Pseudobutyrivibrio sp.]